ncbi:hypothetical protein [Streptacidiphilus sp. EB129]|uniref:hypothetical protein n=1 Tax=Streptacidiphilus sp. EB129 TaxID=3156262 RepID=UPI0035184606
MQLAMSESLADTLTWAAFIVALGGIPIGAWFAYKAARPDARLYYRLDDILHLVVASSYSEKLRTTWGDCPVSDPTAATLVIEVRSRADIRKDDFVQHLTFDLGAKIVDQLSSAADEPALKAEWSESTVSFEPTLIPRDTNLSVTFLLEGEPKITYPQRALADVKVISGHMPPKGQLPSLGVGLSGIFVMLISMMLFGSTGDIVFAAPIIGAMFISGLGFFSFIYYKKYHTAPLPPLFRR